MLTKQLNWNELPGEDGEANSFETTIFNLEFAEDNSFSCGYFIAESSKEDVKDDKKRFSLYFDADTIYQIGMYPTLKEAQENAQTHYGQNILH